MKNTHYCSYIYSVELYIYVKYNSVLHRNMFLLVQARGGGRLEISHALQLSAIIGLLAPVMMEPFAEDNVLSPQEGVSRR